MKMFTGIYKICIWSRVRKFNIILEMKRKKRKGRKKNELPCFPIKGRLSWTSFVLPISRFSQNHLIRLRFSISQQNLLWSGKGSLLKIALGTGMSCSWWIKNVTAALGFLWFACESVLTMKSLIILPQLSRAVNLRTGNIYLYFPILKTGNAFNVANTEVIKL